MQYYLPSINMAMILPITVTQLKTSVIFFSLISTISVSNSWPTRLKESFLDIPFTGKLMTDTASVELVSLDYGRIVKDVPHGVFHPSSVDEIKALVKLANNPIKNIGIAARGEGHSVRGQSMARDGIVVRMDSLRKDNEVKIVLGPSGQSFADVGAHELWVNVLNATLSQGLTPVSWTDYLYLSVGGTLSNAGISGQTFKFGPQISNVVELDVITGKGDFVTCSAVQQPELFYGVLGGLGQFGVISRARIRLEPAPKRVKWVRMLYNNFSAFAKDQEHLISIQEGIGNSILDYVEGSLLLNQGIPDVSFYPAPDQPRIISLVKESSIVYILELAKYYDDSTKNTIDEELKTILEGLSFLPGFVFDKDASYFEFLDRVRAEELTLRSIGLWEVPHPWMNLFVPKSRMEDFDKGVFRDIILNQNNVTSGFTLVYPMHRAKWDNRMSAVIPDEDIFYLVAFLHAAVDVDYELYDNLNREILEFCRNTGINFKQYLPQMETAEEWKAHFGPKWQTFQRLKYRYDPKRILSPGQGIFN